MTAHNYQVEIWTNNSDELGTFVFSVAGLNAPSAIRSVMSLLLSSPDAWSGELVKVQVTKLEALG